MKKIFLSLVVSFTVVAHAQFQRLDRVDFQVGQENLTGIAVDHNKRFAYMVTNPSGFFTDGARLTKYDLQTNQVIETTELNTNFVEPRGIFLDSQSNTAFVYTIHRSPSVIFKVDLNSLQVLDSQQLNLTLIHGLALDHTNDIAYIGTLGQNPQVLKFDMATFQVVDNVTFNTTTSQSFQTGVIDANNEFAYYGTSSFNQEGTIIKIRLSDFTIVDTKTVGTAHSRLKAAVIDSTGQRLVLATEAEPSSILVVDLQTFNGSEAITLPDNYDRIHAGMADPSQPFAYFATTWNDEDPGISRILKIDLTTITLVDEINLPANINFPSLAFTGPSNQSAFFSTEEIPSELIEFNFNPFGLNRITELELTQTAVTTGAIDPQGNYAYLGFGDNNSGTPTNLVKFNLRTLQREGRIILEGRNFDVPHFMIDSQGQFGYLSRRSNQDSIFKFDLNNFSQIGELPVPHDDGYRPRGNIPQPQRANIGIGVMGPNGIYGYYAKDQVPPKIIKVNLISLNIEDTLTLPPSDDIMEKAILGPNGQFAYFFNDSTRPAIYKINLNTFEFVSSLLLNTGDGVPVLPMIGPNNEFMYLATSNKGIRIVKIDLNTFTRDSGNIIPTGSAPFLAGSQSPDRTHAYLSIGFSAPDVHKVDLVSMESVDRITLEDGERTPTFSLIDPNEAFLYVFPDTEPGKLVRIFTGDLSAARVNVDAGPTQATTGSFIFNLQGAASVQNGLGILTPIVQWTVLSAPSAFTDPSTVIQFDNPSSPVTNVNFLQTGNYELQLSGEIRDPFDVFLHASEDTISVTVNQLAGQNLAIANKNFFDPSKGEALTIQFGITSDSNAKLTIYDRRGNEVRKLFDGLATSPVHTVTWNGRNDSGEKVSSGYYRLLIEKDGQTERRKIVVIQ